MAILITMPSLSPTMESGVVSSWAVKEGDFIESGEILAEIETDKAMMDFQLPDEGYLRKIIANLGDELPVGAPIAILSEEKDEDISDLIAQAAAYTPADATDSAGGAPQPAAVQTAPQPPAAAQATPQQPPAAQAAALQSAPASPTPTQGAGGRVRISPYALRLAEEHNVNWQNMNGSGPGGRVVAGDIEAQVAGGTHLAAPPPKKGPDLRVVSPATSTKGASEKKTASASPAQRQAPAPIPARTGEAFEDQPLSMMRKAIARKMLESKQNVPHFQATKKIRVEALMKARVALNEELAGAGKISVNDLIVKGCALALSKHPIVNSQFLGDKIRRFFSVDICVAVGTDDGLITPVVRDVDAKGIAQISAEIKELAGRAREKRLEPEEYTGGTFTVSNLGMYGITEFNGIINTPQASLLAVSAIIDEPVVEAGAVVAGKTMSLTLSSDHRIVDGLAAAEFMATLTRILENPVTMML